MKKSKKIPALILSALLAVGTNAAVCGAEEFVTGSVNVDEYDIDTEVDVYDGYSFIYGQAAVSFESFDDYVNHSFDASEKIGHGHGYSMNYYLENYDYIYVPTYLKDKTDDISCVFITPRFCRVTYKLGNARLDTYHYFQSDNQESCEDFQPAYDDNNLTSVGNITYYIKKGYGNKPETYKDKTAYCCNYDGSHFLFSTGFGLENMGDTPFTKVYIDKHIREKDGKLYYMNDMNEPQSGWKMVSGHKYYFRLSDKTAVCGRKAEIDGIVYSFNEGGICTGKFSGYALYGNDRVYYKDGVIQRGE